VFANISGLITVLPDGKIHSINNNFALMLFGFTQSELIGKVCYDGVLSTSIDLVSTLMCPEKVYAKILSQAL